MFTQTLAVMVILAVVVLVTVAVMVKSFSDIVTVAPGILVVTVTASPFESLTDPLIVNSSPTVISIDVGAEIFGAKLPSKIKILSYHTEVIKIDETVSYKQETETGYNK